MGNLEGIIGGLFGFGATAVVAPYAAPAWYAINTGIGIMLGYNYGKIGGQKAHGAH